MRPSDIWVKLPLGFTDLFGMSEAEIVASVIVLYLAANGDDWEQELSFPKIAEWFFLDADRARKVPPWIDPGRGFTHLLKERWLSSIDGWLRFTVNDAFVQRVARNKK